MKKFAIGLGAALVLAAGAVGYAKVTGTCCGCDLCTICSDCTECCSK